MGFVAEVFPPNQPSATNPIVFQCTKIGLKNDGVRCGGLVGGEDLSLGGRVLGHDEVVDRCPPLRTLTQLLLTCSYVQTITQLPYTSWFPVLIGFGSVCLRGYSLRVFGNANWCRVKDQRVSRNCRMPSAMARLGASRPPHYCTPPVNVLMN